MPLTTHPLPFGLRDVKLVPLDAAETEGTAVDLPVSRTFSFSETVDSEELMGDDVTVAAHDSNTKVEWELESGGLPFEAYQVMAGGDIDETGVTPAQIKTYTKLRNQSRPYFNVQGQAISDSGGDVHCNVYRCKADDSLEGEFGQGAFFLTSASGKGYGLSDDDKLYEFVQHETATAIS
jgi:hypothetical protein